MRPDSFPNSPARVPTAHKNSQGRTGRDNSRERGCDSAVEAAWRPGEGRATANDASNREARTSARRSATRRRRMAFIRILFVCETGRMFFQRLGSRLEGRRYVDGFAYAKIEARSLARAQCGKVSRFVLFAADIPSIAE